MYIHDRNDHKRISKRITHEFKTLHLPAFNNDKPTNSSPSGNVASLRSLLGKRCITFPLTSPANRQQKSNVTIYVEKETRKFPEVCDVCTDILAARHDAEGNPYSSNHSLSPCLFQQRQNNQQDGTFLEMECHVGDHIHPPFPLDAILDWASRMR